MAFISMPGIKGKVYVPENNPNKKKKHPCSDCYDCAWCSDSRCEVCRIRKSSKKQCSGKCRKKKMK